MSEKCPKGAKDVNLILRRVRNYRIMSVLQHSRGTGT